VTDFSSLINQLKPNTIVRGALFPEPVQVIIAVPMGMSVKLIGKGTTVKIVDTFFWVIGFPRLESISVLSKALLDGVTRGLFGQ
jgi:hypothetical protein